MNNEIIKMQEVISHQAEELSQLSDVLYAQQKELDILKKQVAKLTAEIIRLKNNDSGIKAVEEETPPPHY